MPRQFSNKAFWFSSILLLLCGSCDHASFRRETRDAHPVDQQRNVKVNHYVSGEIVSVDLGGAAMGIREAVEMNRRRITRLRLTPSTAVLKGGERGTVQEIRRGDFVMVRYSERPDGVAYAEEVRVVSKPDSNEPKTNLQRGTSGGQSDEAASDLGG